MDQMCILCRCGSEGSSRIHTPSGAQGDGVNHERVVSLQCFRVGGRSRHCTRRGNRRIRMIDLPGACTHTCRTRYVNNDLWRRL